MDQLKPKIIKDVSKIAGDKIDKLSVLWQNLFEPEIGCQHMEMLLEHVDAFFTDIISETQNRATAIREKIESLNRERMDLKRLLKEDVSDCSTANVPLHTLQMNIDESLKTLRDKLQRRHDEIELLLREQDEVCEELAENLRPLVSDPLPSENEMQQFREYLDALKDERYNRYGEIMQLRTGIKQLMEKLEVTSIGQYQDNLINDTEIKPTCSNIANLKEMNDELVDQYEKMKFQIEDMRKRLAQLWKYLDIPEKQQHKFQKYTEVNQTTYNKLIHEVQRCEKIKKDNIKVFIEKVRVEIEEYWDKCLKSDAERMRFPSYTASTFNEDVLELHEDELRDLKMFYENHEPLFHMIQERQDLWNQMESLQNKEQDPKRYNNRGGQLLKEEKERKMITMKLPKIEAKLIEMVEKFEAENNRPFTMYGVRIQDIIEREYEAKRQEKITKSGKKVLATPLRTPGRVNMTGIRTPLTIEQTIINRTAMKTTGGRLRVAQSRQALSTTASSTASSVASTRTDTGKRRLLQQRTGPIAKRQLLSTFGTPSNILKPQNSNVNTTGAMKKPAPAKNASMKVYNVGSIIKRRSRKSNGKKRSSIYKKRNSVARQRPVPDILVSSEDTMTERDATSYEGFENYVYQSKSVVRSSEVARPHFLAVNHHGFASPIVKKPSTPSMKRIGTPSASTPSARGLQPKELEFSMII